MSSFYIQNFKHLACFCGCTGRFESYLDENRKDTFSHNEAHIFWSFGINELIFSYSNERSAMGWGQCCINPYLPSGDVHPYQLDKSISNFRSVWCTFSFLFYFELKFLLANSEHPYQTRHSAASDLGLHCLPMSQKWDVRLIWVKHSVCVRVYSSLTLLSTIFMPLWPRPAGGKKLSGFLYVRPSICP